jgi:hypothetical protein
VKTGFAQWRGNLSFTKFAPDALQIVLLLLSMLI